MSASTGLLRIDLNAIADNWRRLDAVSAAETAAVVKADAYGLGMAAVAPALYRAGCRHFFVATLEEGLALRALLPQDGHCLVLGGVPRGYEQACADSRLIPVISSVAALERWLAVAASHPCTIKFDTGMTRLGIPTETLLAPEHRPLLAAARVVVAMSHLACAEERDSDRNPQQREIFESVRSQLASLWPNARWSLANSSGIFLGEHFHADLVRPGAALYGFNPCPGLASPIRPVATLQLPVLQLRRVDAPARVGYGAAGRAEPGAILAVVAGGYADGVHRLLGTEGSGFCQGVEVPVIGRVSMDTTVFDVSAVPGVAERLASGNWAEMNIDILTAAHNVSEISARNHSLGYEVLTSLRAPRYRREYVPDTEGAGR